jgi:signal transduction histidine kinase
VTGAGRIDLAAEVLRAQEASRDRQAPYLPLSVAAAIAFHQAHGSTKAIVTRADYNDALNIAASALSRLIPILTLRDPREGRVAISVDLVRQRFARGATELRHDDGTRSSKLSVKTSEFRSALSLLKRSGILGTSFAVAAPEKCSREARDVGETGPKDTNLRLRLAHDEISLLYERIRQLDSRSEAARSLAAELVLAEQRERRRIAEVLHEHLAQSIAGCRMHLDAVGEKLEGRLRDDVDQVADSLNLACETTRALALELSPPLLVDFGLVRSLRWLARQQATLYRLKVAVHARSRDEPQDFETRVFLFHAARLLLLNVARHAQVREAAVALRARDGLLELAVSDAGAGFDPCIVQARGQCSLKHLEGCAGALGGNLSIDSQPGAGARIAVRIPGILEGQVCHLAAEPGPR